MERLVERPPVLMLVLSDGRTVALVLANEALEPALGFDGVALDVEVPVTEDRCAVERRDILVEASEGATLALLDDITSTL